MSVIRPSELKLEAHGKRPSNSDDHFVRLGTKKDAKLLEKASKEVEELRETVQCAVP